MKRGKQVPEGMTERPQLSLVDRHNALIQSLWKTDFFSFPFLKIRNKYTHYLVRIFKITFSKTSSIQTSSIQTTMRPINFAEFS